MRMGDASRDVCSSFLFQALARSRLSTTSQRLLVEGFGRCRRFWASSEG